MLFWTTAGWSPVHDDASSKTLVTRRISVSLHTRTHTYTHAYTYQQLFSDHHLVRMADVVPPQFQALVRYDEQWKVLICRQHQVAVPLKSLPGHLRSEHNIHHLESKSLLEALSAVPCCQTKQEFPQPLNGSPPILDLEVIDGFQCPHCSDGDAGALSRSDKVVRKHVLQRHMDIPPPRRNVDRTRVKLQSWGVRWQRGYWTVELNTAGGGVAAAVASSRNVNVNDSTESEPITWEKAMIHKEKERREAMHSRLLEFHARNEKDDTTPWLLFTKWGELFKDREVKTIAETRYLNTENQEVIGMSLISKSQLRLVHLGFDKLLTWSLETLETTEWNMCHWLRSPRQSEYSPKPFRKPQETATLVRYSGYWKQLLLFCLRTALLEKEVCDRIYGVEFTTRQRELAMELKGLRDLSII